MKKIFLLCCLAPFLLLNQALAESPSFTYLQVEYVNGDMGLDFPFLGNESTDVDGFILTGSIELGIFLFQASRSELGAKSDNSFYSIEDISSQSLAFGLTFELPFSSVYALARYRRDDVVGSSRSPSANFEVDSSALGYEIGARMHITDSFEINANLGQPMIGEGKQLGAGVMYRINDFFGITGKFNSVSLEDDDDVLDYDYFSIGLRASF